MCWGLQYIKPVSQKVNNAKNNANLGYNIGGLLFQIASPPPGRCESFGVGGVLSCGLLGSALLSFLVRSSMSPLSLKGVE